MREVMDTLLRAAKTPASILILGESGTGKSIAARAVHQHSLVPEKPFITVSCPSLSKELLESDLFGHVKGAFTGAVKDHWGKVKVATGGTLFLDEIGEIDASIQIKLLRFLGERTFERVGSNKTLSADVRLIAATNKNLDELVKAGSFREDLFFRLRVVEIRLPPLRERPEDIPLLAQAFLREFARENDKPVSKFSPEAMDLIMRHAWPGNVRELRTAVEHAVVLCKSDKITPRDLPPSARQANGAPAVAAPARASTDLSVKEAEKQLIIRALKATNGNRTLAAKKLGMSRRTLYRKLTEYGLEGL
jgi:DNA-binding NtrC family response regulator